MKITIKKLALISMFLLVSVNVFTEEVQKNDIKPKFSQRNDNFIETSAVYSEESPKYQISDSDSVKILLETKNSDIESINIIYNNIEKSHVSDAFIISKNFNSIRLGYYYKVRLIRRHNRQIHKQKIPKGGIKRLNQSPFEVFGFRLFDRVMFENSYYFIFGRRKTGSFNIRDIDGKSQKNITYKKFKLSRCKRFMIQKEMN